MSKVKSQAADAAADGNAFPHQEPNSVVQDCDQPTWIAIRVIDANGKSVTGLPFAITLTNGKSESGLLESQQRWDSIPCGTCDLDLTKMWDGLKAAARLLGVPGKGGGTTPSTDHNLIADTQRRLSLLGYDPGPIDGVAGPRTAAAIRRYQHDNGLTEDGAVTQTLHDGIQTAPDPVIARAQQRLKREGYNAGTADGLAGPRTHQAVRAWKSEQGSSKAGLSDNAALQELGS